jgi:hypothetical protein
MASREEKFQITTFIIMRNYLHAAMKCCSDQCEMNIVKFIEKYLLHFIHSEGFIKMCICLLNINGHVSAERANIKDRYLKLNFETFRAHQLGKRRIAYGQSVINGWEKRVFSTLLLKPHTHTHEKSICLA